MDRTSQTAQEHRDAGRGRGRGRKAFWVAVALSALFAVVWLTPTRAQRPHGPGGFFHGQRGDAHSLATLGAELREHAGLLAYAGLTERQVARIADAFDQRIAVFAELESGRAAIEGRVADAVAAENLDPTELAVTLGEARELAERTLDESFDLIAAVASELTPAQRADLVRHWRD